MSTNVFHTIVIGAGASGLVIAKGLARAKKQVLLVDARKPGGDCTHFGCIPSKTLVSCSKAASFIKNASSKGIELESTIFNADKSLSIVRAAVENVYKDETPEVLEQLGITYLKGKASLVNSKTVCINGESYSAKYIVIATGSSPLIPPIEGLNTTSFHTNETIFTMTSIPKDLAVIGGGPIGCELAQAFSSLGSNVTIITENGTLLPKLGKYASKALLESFEKKGIKVLNGTAKAVSQVKDGILITLSTMSTTILCSELLIATGRSPNTRSLTLEKAGIVCSNGIPVVDAYLRTNKKNVFIVGDCNALAPFTHMAEAQARAALQSILIFKKKYYSQGTPFVVFTDPELAHVGLTEAQAKEKYSSKSIKTYTIDLKNTDRAKTTGASGFVQIVSKKWSGKILGATIQSPRAGEMIVEISMAIQYKISLRKLSLLIHPYPSWSLAIRAAADLWLKETILPLLKKFI